MRNTKIIAVLLVLAAALIGCSALAESYYLELPTNGITYSTAITVVCAG